jgi:hypothetical protein
MMNTQILPELGATWWLFQSKGPVLEDNATWSQALTTAIDSLAITDYEKLWAILSEQLGFNLKGAAIDGETPDWMKMPPGYVKAFVALNGAFPTKEDLEAGPLLDEAPEAGAGAEPVATTGTGRSRRVRRATGVEHEAMRMVETILKARQILAERAGADA